MEEITAVRRPDPGAGLIVGLAANAVVALWTTPLLGAAAGSPARLDALGLVALPVAAFALVVGVPLSLRDALRRRMLAGCWGAVLSLCPLPLCLLLAHAAVSLSPPRVAP